MTAETRSHEIAKFPARRLDAARRELETLYKKIQRAAAKTGQDAPPAPTITIVREYWESICGKCKTSCSGIARGPCPDMCPGSLIPRAVLDLSIEWTPPKLAGWELIAVVEPLIGGNLIRAVPHATLRDGELDAWRASDLRCDHCETIRKRSETFVVRADGSDAAIAAGTYRQVGRNCIEAFLGGQSPLAVLSSVGWPAAIQKIGEEGEGGSGSAPAPSHDPAEFLSWVASTIRVEGWLSRTAAHDRGLQATSDRALYVYVEPWRKTEEWHTARAKLTPTPEDAETATSALAWARELAASSDYERNLQLVASQSTLDRKHAGILASAVVAHARALGKQRETQAKTARTPSAHLGTIGETLSVADVTCERVASFAGSFGAVHVHTFRDEGGNALIWKTSRPHAAQGDVVKVIGTVKTHGEYRGELQTELTRCAVLTAVEVAQAAVIAATKATKTTKKRTRKSKAAPGAEPTSGGSEPGPLAPSE